MIARRVASLRGPQHRVIAAALFSLLWVAASASAQTNTFPATGNVGIGTTTPVFKLHVFGGNLRIEDVAPGNPQFNFALGGVQKALFGIASSPGAFTQGSNTGDVTVRTEYQRILFSTNAGASNALLVDTSNNVGIGTMSPVAKLHVAGDTQVDGNIAAKYQDVAEWVKYRGNLAAGAVVIIDPREPNCVAISDKSYDTRVAGVVSPKPGLLLGESGEDKTKVAHSGRVKVKVDANYGPIAVGDLLVTSPTPGHAMRSEPAEVGNMKLHRPGTLIGKALEPLEDGRGEILILLTLQ